MMIPREILNIEIGDKCNNNCIFCSDEKVVAPSLQKNLAAIQTCYRDSIIFVQKEPTLSHDLFPCIRRAKERGFRTISLSTNGRMLSYASFCERIIREGVNEITISIHGPEKIHECITRTPGSFSQTLKAFKNLKDKGIHVISATTITKANIGYIGELLQILKPLDVHLHVFNMLEPKGMGKNIFERMAPDPKQIEKIFEEIDTEKVRMNIPPCAAGKLLKCAGLPEKNIGTEDHSCYAKREACRICSADRFCKGFYKDYIELYGWENLEPIQGNQSG